MAERPQPQSDAQNKNQNRQDQPTIVVDDPDQFSRTRQLRSIFDARQDFVDTRRESRNLLQGRKISLRQKNERLFRAIQDFVILLEPVLWNSEEGKAVLNEQIFESKNCCRLTELPRKSELKEMEMVSVGTTSERKQFVRANKLSGKTKTCSQAFAGRARIR